MLAKQICECTGSSVACQTKDCLELSSVLVCVHGTQTVGSSHKIVSPQQLPNNTDRATEDRSTSSSAVSLHYPSAAPRELKIIQQPQSKNTFPNLSCYTMTRIMRSRTPAPEQQQQQKSEGVERHALNKRPSRRRHQRQSSKRKIHPVDTTTITITTSTTSKLPATSSRHVKSSVPPPPQVPESTLSSPPFAGHHHHHKSRRRFHHGRLRALSQHMRGHKCVTCNQPRRSCQCHVVSSE